MTDAADWPQANDAFLAAALAWLRLRLQRLAVWEPPPVVSVIPPAPAAEPHAPSFAERFLRRGSAETAPPPLLALPPASEAVTEAQIAAAAKAMADAESTDPPPALAVLAQRFGLSRFERDVLLLCAAMELDTRTGPL